LQIVSEFFLLIIILFIFGLSENQEGIKQICYLSYIKGKGNIYVLVNDFNSGGLVKYFSYSHRRRFYLSMKRVLFIFLISQIAISVLAQKVTIQVSQTKVAGLKGWQITNGQNITIFSGDKYLQNDTVTFSLDANNYYFLKVSVSEINKPDTSLFTLILNGEPVLYIKTDIGKGDHLFPFYTGTKKTIAAKITGGTSTVISEFPWQVYFITGDYRCGGSIIDNKWVITAAHCTQTDAGANIPASEMFVRVGLNNPSNSSEGKEYSVSEYIVHENFNSSTLLNDIALLKLKDSINYTNATPIKFVDSDDVADGAIVPGVMSWVTGWGYSHVSPYVIPTALQKVQLPIISTAVAEKVWGTIPSTDLMAGYLNGNKDACNGDSGGPLVVPVLDGYKLAGIVSWGSTQCNTYGAYTRVSDFESWIRAKTGIVKAYKPPVPAGDLLICQGTESSTYSISPVTDAASYEWKILPASAGTITRNNENASVIWDLSYTGSVKIIVRVTINGVVSDWAQLDAVVATNTVLSSQSGDAAICAGESVTLSVSAEGYNLSYIWYKDDQIIKTGSSADLVFSAAATNNSGIYKCKIAGSCGVITTSPITLTVYALTNITYVSPDTKVPFGNDATLEVTSEGHDLVYQWQKNDTIISNSNSYQLALQNVNANNTGIYKVTVTGTCGTEISDTIYLYVERPDYSTDPEVYLWPSFTRNEFAVALSTDAIYNIQMFSTLGKKIKEITNCSYKTTINISTLASGVYIVRIYNNDFSKSIKVIRE
jgi:secreted trypsin-like serine protease